MISDDELKNLADLARIDVPEEEFEGLKKDIGSILEYIEQVQEVSDFTEDSPPCDIENDSLRNIMREDKNPHKSGKYTEDLMNEVPDVENGYVKVKKIL